MASSMRRTARPRSSPTTLAVIDTMRRWLMRSYSCGMVLSVTLATSRSSVAAPSSFCLTGIMPTSALEFIWAGGTCSCT